MYHEFKFLMWVEQLITDVFKVKPIVVYSVPLRNEIIYFFIYNDIISPNMIMIVYFTVIAQ